MLVVRAVRGAPALLAVAEAKVLVTGAGSGAPLGTLFRRVIMRSVTQVLLHDTVRTIGEAALVRKVFSCARTRASRGERVRAARAKRGLVVSGPDSGGPSASVATPATVG